MKKICTLEDIEIFKKSGTFIKLMTFLTDLQKSVESKGISETKEVSEKFK